MSTIRLLIDTNVFIGLEDLPEVAVPFSILQELAERHRVEISVHKEVLEERDYDKNDERRRVPLSDFKDFLRIKKRSGIKEKDVETGSGQINHSNDVVNVTLLHALEMGDADFLVTEAQDLHQCAERKSSTLGARVLYVADAISLLRTTYEATDVVLPAVEEVEAHTIAQNDPIFLSLYKDYPAFETWWREKCVKSMRKCWVVMDEERVAGLVVRKEEHVGDTDAFLPGKKILKVCTFKVRAESRGVKLGELLLKQVLWYAQSNNYDIVYLTTFSGQETLIALLKYYGFSHTHNNSNDEQVYEKSISRQRLQPDSKESLFNMARLHYPRFVAGEKVSAYVIPIREEFHEILFPELMKRNQLSLFGKQNLHRPGNTIRKVYLCRAPANIYQQGALLFFYKGKASEQPSQAITTIGVFEGMQLAHSTEELRQFAGGRSVYSDQQLKDMEATYSNPVKVINFLLMAHFEPPINLDELINSKVFNDHPPQSIMHLSPAQQAEVLKHSVLGFAVGDNEQ